MVFILIFKGFVYTLMVFCTGSCFQVMSFPLARGLAFSTMRLTLGAQTWKLVVEDWLKAASWGSEVGMLELNCRSSSLSLKMSFSINLILS